MFFRNISQFYAKMKLHSTLGLFICLITLGGIAPIDEELKNDVEFLENIHKYDSESGCLCPHNKNTTGTFLYFCGRELKPHNSTIKCAPEGRYRCLNGRHFAVHEQDCMKFKMKCIQQINTPEGEPCEYCKRHAVKTCSS